ncbi:MAG: hypothetical protein R3B07_02780 [Polyangiaceae bacterium]
MSRYARLATCCALMGGCASTQPVGEPAHQATPIATESPEPQSPVTPKASQCIVTEDTLDEDVALRLSPGSVKLARLVDVAASLTLTHDAPRLTLESNGVVLWTPYDANEHPLHLRRAIALAGVLTPTPGASVAWQGSSPSKLESIRYQAGPRLNQLVVDDTVPCSDLGLNQTSYEVAVASEGTAKLLIGPSPMRPAPGSAASITLPQGDSPIACLELERKGELSLVQATDGGNAILTGWVASAALRDDPSPRGLGLVGIGGGGRGYGRVPQDVEFSQCKGELPLYLPHPDGSPQQVGFLREGTRFEQKGDAPDEAKFVQVDLWQGWIWPVGEGHLYFLVSLADVAPCERSQ